MSRVEASVIVALNPHDSDVRAVLEGYALQAELEKRFELVIVDGGARAGAAAACARFAAEFPQWRIRCVTSTNRGRAAANNAGADASTSGLLIFVADDFIPGASLVRAHLDFHRHLVRPAVGIGPAWFTAGCRDDPFRRWLEDSGRLFGVPFRTPPPDWPRDFFYVGNASLSRGLFERAGGFDETFEHDLLDDFEFGIRLRAYNARTHHLPKALAWHDHAVTIAERWQAMHRSGVAARGYDQTHTGPSPWAPIASLSAEALVRRVEDAGADGAGRNSADYFRSLMDLGFVRGYGGESSALPEALASA